MPLGLSAALAAGGGALGVRFDPYLPCNFLVEVEGLLVGGFSEVTGLEMEVETEEVREGGVNDYSHQLPVRARYTNITLRHGLTDMDYLLGWMQDVIANEPGLYGRAKVAAGLASAPSYRRDGSIFLLDRRRLPVCWWNFRNAYPVHWTGPDLDAETGTAAIESIELVHEGLTKPPASRVLSAVRLAAKTATQLAERAE